MAGPLVHAEPCAHVQRAALLREGQRSGGVRRRPERHRQGCERGGVDVGAAAATAAIGDGGRLAMGRSVRRAPLAVGYPAAVIVVVGGDGTGTGRGGGRSGAQAQAEADRAR